MQFDCQLGDGSLIRLIADNADAAKTEYFRLYGIIKSDAPWTCTPAKDGPPPIESAGWAKLRKQLGTDRAESVVKAQSPKVK